uniref:GPI-anchored protein PB15E9.01c-like n=1 Tax=Saccoglossus kowalevskii TaxID=10224 RepID=A0ABM0MWR9_SACKO|nr:PREDICTED: putative GPI-anchored protein PB15E9.01c-like [Saccoglossus kowalevskii]
MDVLDECRGPNKGVQANFLEVFDRKKRKLSTKGVKILDDTKVDDNFTKNGKNFMTRSIQVEIELEADEKIQEISKYSKSGNGSRVHSPDIDDLCRKKFKPIAPKPILGKDQHQPVVVATVPVKFVSSCNTTPSENSKLNTMSSDCRTMVLNSGFSVLGNAPIILQSGSKHMDGGITKVFTLNAQNMTSDGIVQVVVPPPNSSITAMPSPNMGMNHSTLLSQTSLSNITEQQSQDINWASAKAMMNGVQAQNYAAMQQTQSHVPAGLNMSNTVGNNNIPVNANLPQNVKDILRLRPSKYKYSLLLNSPMYSNIKTAMGITPMPNAAVIAENTSQGYQVASNVSHNNMPVVPASYGNTAAPLMSPVLISAVQPTNVSAVQLSMLPQGQTVMTPVMNPSQLSPALHSPGIPIQTSIPPISANTVGTEARNVNNSNSGILYQNNSQSQSYARTMPNTSALYSVPKPTGQYVQSYASTNQPLRTSSQQKHPSFFIDTDMVIRNTANMSQPTLIPPVHSVNTSRMLHIPPVTSTVISETCTSFRTDSQSVSVSETSINSTATGSTSPAVTTWTPKPSTPVSTHVVTMYKPPSLSTMISNLAAQMPYQRLPLSRSHPAQAQQIQQPFQSQLQQQPQPVSISGLSRLPLSLQEPTQTATTMFIPHLQNHSRENRIPSKTLNTSKLSMSENSTINKTHCEGLLSVPTTSTRQVHMYQPNASNSVVSNSNNRFSSSPVTSNLNVGQKVNASPVQQSPTSSLSTVSSASSIAPTNGAYFAHQITSTSLMPRPSIHPSSTFSQQVASTDAIPGPPMQLTSPLPVTSIVHVASTLPVISSTFHNINANKNSFVQSAYPPTLQYSNGYTGTSPAPASAAIPVAISRQPNSATFQNLTNTISRNVPNSLNSNAVSNDTPRPENANRSQHLHLPSRTTPHVIQNVPRCLQSTLIPMSDGVSQARQNSRKSPSSTASITLPIRTSIIPQRSVSSLHMEHPAPPPPPISRSNIAAPVCQISAVSSTSRSDTTSLSWPAHAAAISTQHHVPLVTVTTAPVNSRLSNINNTSFTFSNHPRSSMCSSNVQLNNNIPTTSSIGTSISTMFSPPSMTMAHSGCATQQRLQRKSTSGGTPSPSQLPMNVVSEGQRFTQNIARNVLSVPPFVNQSGIAFSQQRGNLTQNSSTNNSVRSPTMPNAIGTSVQPGLSPYIENNVCVSNQFIGNQSSKNSNQLSHGTSTLQLQNVTSDTCVNRDMDQITRPVVSVVSPTSSHTSPTTSNNLQQKTMPTGHSEQNPSSNVMRLGLDQSTGVDVPMQMTNQTTILNTLTLRQKQGRGTRSIQNRQVLPSQITGKQLANSSDSSLPTRQPRFPKL